MAIPNLTYSVTEAGREGGWSYPQTMRLLLVGRLDGEKQDGRWRIDASSVRRLKEEQISVSRDSRRDPAVV